MKRAFYDKVDPWLMRLLLVGIGDEDGTMKFGPQTAVEDKLTIFG